MEVTSEIPGCGLTPLLQPRENLWRLLHFEIHSSMRLPGVWMYLVFSVWLALSMYSLGPSTTSRPQYSQSMDFPRRAFRAGGICRQPRERIPVPGLKQDGHLEPHLRSPEMNRLFRPFSNNPLTIFPPFFFFSLINMKLSLQSTQPSRKPGNCPCQ